jgi:hypothetical protein
VSGQVDGVDVVVAQRREEVVPEVAGVAHTVE